ncbi:hypothetical protein COAQ111491_02165 [Comamonas aquatilis]|uniref:hypothetical protein n=1 Tax=Comamonas aquatilis TaxID=1778406 RepID=UPI0039F02BE2
MQFLMFCMEWLRPAMPAANTHVAVANAKEFLNQELLAPVLIEFHMQINWKSLP